MSSEYREVQRQLAEILKEEKSARGGWLVDLQNRLYTWFDTWDRMFRDWLDDLLGIPIPVGWGWLLPVLIILILLFHPFPAPTGSVLYPSRGRRRGFRIHAFR